MLGEHLRGRPVGEQSAVGVRARSRASSRSTHTGVRCSTTISVAPVASATRSTLARTSRDALRVEVRGRLVEQQQPRAHREHAGEREPLLLTARQRRSWRDRAARPGPLRRAPPHPRTGSRLRGHAEVLAPECDVVAHLRQHDPGIRILQHEARPARAATPAAAPSIRSVPCARPRRRRRARPRARRAASTCPAPEAPSSSTRSPGSIVKVDVGARPAADARRSATPSPQPDDGRRRQRVSSDLARSSRPAAKRLSAPVAASARTSSQPTSPARIAPETSSEPGRSMLNSSDFRMLGELP